MPLSLNFALQGGDGQRHAQKWLARNKASIGHSPTLDLAGAFY